MKEITRILYMKTKLIYLTKYFTFQIEMKYDFSTVADS